MLMLQQEADYASEVEEKARYKKKSNKYKGGKVRMHDIHAFADLVYLLR